MNHIPRRARALFILVLPLLVLLSGCIGQQGGLETITLPPETVEITVTMPATIITTDGITVTAPSETIHQTKTLPPETVIVTYTREIPSTYTTTEISRITTTVKGDTVVLTKTTTRVIQTTITLDQSRIDQKFSIGGSGTIPLVFVLGLVALALLYRRRRT